MTNEEINGYSYRVTQATKTQLIVIMFDMALNYISDAVNCYENQEIEAFRHHLKRAQRVINQLTSSLDMRYSISNELLRLYVFMGTGLVKCSIRKDVEELKAISRMLQKLRNAFHTISENDNSGPIMKNTQQIYAGLTYSNGKLNEYQEPIAKRGFTV